MSAPTRLERFCLPVTLRCNLRCELCAERSPYYRKPYHPSLNELQGNIDSLFRMIDRIDTFDLTGGEPFLRKDLPELVRYLGEAYRDRIGTLRIVTNGTLFPSDMFFEAARIWADRLFVIIDKYPVAMEKSREIENSFRRGNISSEVRDYSENIYCNGWVDYGDFRQKHSSTAARKLFESCMIPKLGFFVCMVNGLLFPCARARLLHEQGIADVCMECNDPGLTDSGKRTRLKTLLDDEVIEACKYCHGLCADSLRFPPARQLDAKYMPCAGTSADVRGGHGSMFILTSTFNNEKTIGRTIESVLAQTNGDFTYFITDNGSTDSTGAIIQDFARRDKRIKVSACNRNDILLVLILQKIMSRFQHGKSGAYRCTVDGDDALHPRFCETILGLGKKYSPDMIVPGYRRINAKTGEVINTRTFSHDAVICGEQKAEHFYGLRALLLCQWGKVYERRFLNRTSNAPLRELYVSSLPKWHYQKDTMGVLGYFNKAERVVFTGEALYDYYLQVDSVAHQHYFHRLDADRGIYKMYKAFLEQFGPLNKRNGDYLYAIYLSLVEDSIKALYNTPYLNFADKLCELLNLLRAKETQELFARNADPEFANLAKRNLFLHGIREFGKDENRDEESGRLLSEVHVEVDRLEKCLVTSGKR